jgi:hypothetical protein
MLLNELTILEKKEEKEKKIVFVETDPQEPFPKDTISALEKGIKKEARDLEKDWKSPMELVDYVFNDLDVPKPGAYLKNRWNQYLELLKVAVEDLANARGFKSNWTTI